MTQKQVLIVHTRMPAFDRDSGSQDMDNAIRFFLDSGWAVTFVAQEDEAVTEHRHAQRLRDLGVATYAGADWVEKVLRSTRFDLALTSFWEASEAVVPKIREHAPDTRIIVNSMDLHFLRLSRAAFASNAPVDTTFGDQTRRELNVYNAADAVIAVSDKERDLLSDFMSSDRVYTLPLAETIERSTVPLAQRRGMYFVGNFRHVPNQRALEYMAAEVLPLIDPDLLAHHPLTVIGNWLDRTPLDVDPDQPGLILAGWVPEVKPYVEQSRLAVVPLLNGAGVKRKVIQAMMAYTPVVTTPVGAESLDLQQGVHALIAADAPDMAAGITRLLSNDHLWAELADHGADHVDQRHGLEPVRQRFADIVHTVMATPQRVVATTGAETSAQQRHIEMNEAIRARVRMIAEPTAVVVVAQDRPDTVDLGSISAWPFPRGREGEWGGFEPVDGRAAVTHLEALVGAGARYFVVPRTLFGWRHRLPGLFAHLERCARRLHADEFFMLYDLVPERSVVEAPPANTSVAVIGTYAADRTGPSPLLSSELGTSEHLQVEQTWVPAGSPRPAASGADFTVYVDDNAVVPSNFLDDLIALQVALDVERLQPAHASGPASGAPVAERHRGVVAREVVAPTPLPVLSVRAGAEPNGPVALADAVTVGLRTPTPADTSPTAEAGLERIWVHDEAGALRCHQRPQWKTLPRISVLVSTYNRPQLLRAALDSFANQSLPMSDFEVVLVDDGSEGSVVDQLVEEFRTTLQVSGVRIGHAGRSAAKNICVQLAQAPVVLFFDDDDQAAPDYLERHLAAHAAHPDEGVAILGHTDWAPDLELSPLMHFITDVERLMFAYERLVDGQQLDWRGFWEGRISVKRGFLMRHALHDQRLNYSIDVEMGWRLSPHGLKIIYDSSATSIMARPLDFAGFCARTHAKGMANATIGDLHSGTPVAAQLRLDAAHKLWEESGEERLTALRRRATALEARAQHDRTALTELHDTYREAFALLNAKGVAGVPDEGTHMKSLPPTVTPFEDDPELLYDGSPDDAPAEPLITVTLPVWSRTPELAAMAQETIDRIWEVARIPTEVVAIDNGSEFAEPLRAKVYRYPENKGVSIGWNTGIRLATAPVFVVLNSDCRLEPGWDEALYEAATDGRRVAFPYTDHCDGLGFTQPDQGGTAGWCFMMSKAIYEEVGVFDEWFSPAFCEDTDYWHRCWHMGIDLTPVPASRVIHARRTTASTHPHVDWLLTGHRYKYGWKHGVDPMAAPPYYGREITEYHGSFPVPE
jgi:glycosyltransferase involved in cell wall biosynthesis